ncbi:MAG: MarR family transcriptional regulator, partial [Oscillospiraceae bacterium]|nr:MarR family transcriptional regulator [Oscillospiraceae bacterium]
MNPKRENVGAKVQKLSHLMVQLKNRRMEHVGLTQQQANVIDYLYNHPDRDIYQKDIAAHLALKNSSVTSLINNLEKNGFLTKVPDETDARHKKIVLTDKALAIKEQADRHADRIEQQINDGLTTAEQKELLRLLDKVKA